LFAETSDAGTTTGGGTTHEDEKPERRVAAADGNAVYRERASYERDRHLERNYQGEHASSLSCFWSCVLLRHNIPVTSCDQQNILLLFTAIEFAPGGSSPTIVQTKTIKQHYTVVQHNTIKRKQHNTMKRKHKIIRT
jgi:hypothetical protein